MTKTTLCYVEKNGCYLMLHRNKRKHDINKGKWIGIGGHTKDSETPQECIKREALEETGLALNTVKLRGLIYFEEDGMSQEITLFTCDDFTGELITCDEGDLAWVSKHDIYQLNLWEGDPIFLKKLIRDDPYFEMNMVYKHGLLERTSIK